MTVPVPDGDSAVAILKWFVALLVAAITAMAGAFMWLIARFSTREEGVIADNSQAIEGLTDVIESQDSGIEALGEHLQKANQLEHDRQLLEADRQRRDRQ